MEPPSIAVVIPSYRVSRHILAVLAALPPEVTRVYVVDDACPEGSGRIVSEHCSGPRVRVLVHEHNQGVGGAMLTGYRAALADGADIIVKMDGDGQMNPALIPRLVQPIVRGQADYVKGNRFYELDHLRSMPRVRLFGNALLSLINKVASGYWNIMDPTNGFTAIHRTALEMLPLAKLDRGYFFESDMLFRLYTIRAVVRDLPMAAHYGDEVSSLRVGRIALAFPGKYLRAALKRLGYVYFLRDFNAGSLQIVFGSLFLLGGAAFGIAKWIHSAATDVPTTSGAVMLAALPVLIGVQLLLGALNYDVGNVPSIPLQSGAAGGVHL